MKNKEFYNEYCKLFLAENEKLNLISKNDEKFLWEKHVFDSLSIEKFFDKYNMPQTLLDIGTGGGFPSVLIALTYKNIKVTALDSIRKKTVAVENLKHNLHLGNLEVVCEHAENLTQKFDVVTSRAVASLDKICTYALPLLNKNGYFVAYKSKKAMDEIDSAKKVLKKYNAKIVDIIEYDLPLEENHTRNLVVITL